MVDKVGLTQEEIARKANVGRTTVSNMCKDPNYRPRISTWVKVEKALKALGHQVKRDDFLVIKKVCTIENGDCIKISTCQYIIEIKKLFF
ncbi:helix-turn-helix protein [Anoxybacillus sp. BCO1]|nr:helix-turn-helix protein [Anoxybacillus sp. BCO1]